jgi:GntR family phosphonate transport system transcriptional regulator
MSQYEATRYSVRKAMTELQTKGVIRIEQGRGTFVHDDYMVSYQLGTRPRFTNVLIEDGLTPGQEILDITRVSAASEQAKALAGC